MSQAHKLKSAIASPMVAQTAAVSQQRYSLGLEKITKW